MEIKYNIGPTVGDVRGCSPVFMVAIVSVACARARPLALAAPTGTPRKPLAERVETPNP